MKGRSLALASYLTTIDIPVVVIQYTLAGMNLLRFHPHAGLWDTSVIPTSALHPPMQAVGKQSQVVEMKSPLIKGPTDSKGHIMVWTRYCVGMDNATGYEGGWCCDKCNAKSTCMQGLEWSYR